MLKLKYLLLLSLIPFFLSCQQSLPGNSDHHLQNLKKLSLKDQYKQSVIFYRSGNHLMAELPNGQNRKVFTFDAEIDFDANLQSSDSCLHVLTASKGINSWCPERSAEIDLDDIKFISDRTQGLTQRLWRYNKKHRQSFKQGMKLHYFSESKRWYWLSDYALSIRPDKSWSGLAVSKRYYDKISDILEIKKENETYLISSSPYNGLRQSKLIQQGGHWKTGKWKRIGKGLPSYQYIPGLYFYESIPALSKCEGSIFALVDFGKGLYESVDQGKSFRKVALKLAPEAKVTEMQCGTNLGHREDGSSNAYSSLFLSGDNFALEYNWQKQKIRWLLTSDSLSAEKNNQNITNEESGVLRKWLKSRQEKMQEKRQKIWIYNPIRKAFFHIPLLAQKIEKKTAKKRQKEEQGVHGIYLPAHRAKPSKLQKLLPKLKKSGINAIVVDFKDDFGNLVYDSNIGIAKKIKAIRKILNVKKLADFCKKNKITLIARLVVFKDKKLFFYKNNKYAFAKKNSSKPWQYHREYWVDAYSEDVWDYNIDIALELEKMGVDEIQFDYIRFPSDGRKDLLLSKYRKASHMHKPETLYDFLRRANAAITIPIGIDIYGFNAWFQAGAVIGQDISLLSQQVEVISPMYYPSHFGSRWYMQRPRSQRSYRILHDGTWRAIRLSRPQTLIRSYLQAFRLKSPTYGNGYLLNQVHGVFEGGANGFLFWNAAGKYKRLFNALSTYKQESYKVK